MKILNRQISISKRGLVRYRIETDALGKVSVPYDAYYGSETERARKNFPISGITTPTEFVRAYALLKRCSAKANMKTGALDARRGAAIVRACDEIIKGRFSDQFVVDVFQAGAGTSVNMNLNEVIANRAIEFLGGKKGDYKIVHPNDHVNMSQSTNDTHHMNIHLSVYEAIDSALMPSLDGLEKALRAKSKEFGKIVKIGRTHLQDAVPMTLGQEFSGYADALAASAERIRSAQRLLLESPMGGTAIGTGENTNSRYKNEVIKEINYATGLRFFATKRMFKVMSTQLEELAVSNSLRETAVALNKIANDFRLLGSGPVAGFADLLLPPVQPGSSIMPGKVNPSMMEMLNMVCFQVMGNMDTVEQGANSGQLELNIWMPVIAYNLLFSIKILSNAVVAFTELAVKGVSANRKRLAANLELDMSIATALTPYIGYAKAAVVAQRSYKEGKSVKEVALEMKILDRKTLEKVLDPRNFCER